MSAEPIAKPSASASRRFDAQYFLRRGALVIFAALLLGLATSYIGLLISGELSVREADYIVFYAAPKLITAGHGGSLYNFPVLAGVERTVIHPFKLRYGVLPFVYPPYVAVALVPLALLPYTVSFAAWFLINLAVLGASLRALVRYLAWPRQNALLFALAAISFSPVLICLIQGQTSILILALLTAAFFALRSGRDELSGVFLALALTKPPYLVPLLLLLALRGRWRAVGGFVVAAGVLILLPTLLLGLSIDGAYVQTLIRATEWKSQFGYGPHWNQSMLGALQLLLPLGAATPLAALLDLALLGAIGITAKRSAEIDGPFALAAVAGVLISPHVLIHDLVLLILPAGIALRLAPGRTVVWILGFLYLAAAIGLQLIGVVPVQWAVLAMAALAVYLAAKTTPVSPSSAGQKTRMPAVSE